MTESTFYSPRACVLVCCLLLVSAGCAGLNDDDGLAETTNGLGGTWEYLVTNAYEAQYVDCTGDAVVLEGATFYESLALAPVCLAGVTLAADQQGQTFEVESHAVTCSDGAEASVSAVGSVLGPEVGGQWESVSDTGVTAVQMFSGEIVGNSIELAETRRVFEGSFQGACNLLPQLRSIVTVR